MEDKNYSKRFQNGFKILTNTRTPYQVWSDLMYLFATEISNTVTRNIEPLKEVWEDREKEYIRIAKKYNEKERTRIIPQMFTLMVLEIERNPDQDFLGKMYMELEISNKNTGQFFTPYSVCQLMSDITIDKDGLRKAVKEKGYVSINDCACGAGATLIAAVSTCRKLFNRLNYQNHVYFVAQDIDITVANMCYIQLSLLGVAAIVKVGSTISDPEMRVTKETAGKFWFSPMWFSPVWVNRRFFHNLDIAMNEVNKIGKAKPKDKV